MSTFNYARSQATAKRLITKFGGTAAIRRSTTSGPSYDPQITTTDYPCTLVQDMIDMTKVTGTLIETTDRRELIAASDLAITPTTADKLVLGGSVHAIKSVQPLQPDPTGPVIMYEVIFTS